MVDIDDLDNPDAPERYIIYIHDRAGNRIVHLSVIPSHLHEMQYLKFEWSYS